jgi:hypothetical protein
MAKLKSLALTGICFSWQQAGFVGKSPSSQRKPVTRLGQCFDCTSGFLEITPL